MCIRVPRCPRTSPFLHPSPLYIPLPSTHGPLCLRLRTSPHPLFWEAVKLIPWLGKPLKNTRNEAIVRPLIPVQRSGALFTRAPSGGPISPPSDPSLPTLASTGDSRPRGCGATRPPIPLQRPLLRALSESKAIRFLKPPASESSESACTDPQAECPQSRVPPLFGISLKLLVRPLLLHWQCVPYSSTSSVSPTPALAVCPLLLH